MANIRSTGRSESGAAWKDEYVMASMTRVKTKLKGELCAKRHEYQPKSGRRRHHRWFHRNLGEKAKDSRLAKTGDGDCKENKSGRRKIASSSVTAGVKDKTLWRLWRRE